MTCRKIFLFLVAFLVAFQVAGQIKFKTYTSATDTFYWKRYEHFAKPGKVNLSRYTAGKGSRIIDRFLKKNLSLFPQFTNDSARQNTVKNLRKSLYPMDLNGDRQPDMIFSGFSGGESAITQIFLNRNDSFELVFEDYQYITTLNMVNGALHSMAIADPGCCDAYLCFMRDYTVRKEGNSLSFVKGKQIAWYHFTERPKDILKTPVAWSAVYDSMLIRASAALLNEPYNPYLETYGNIIAGYTQKIRGVALARQTDANGLEWYYVEIIPECRPRKSIFYEIGKYPTFIRGWVEGNEIIIRK